MDLSQIYIGITHLSYFIQNQFYYLSDNKTRGILLWNAHKFSRILIHKMAIWWTIKAFDVQPNTLLENSKFFEHRQNLKIFWKIGSKSQRKIMQFYFKIGAAIALNYLFRMWLYVDKVFGSLQYSWGYFYLGEYSPLL